MSQGSRGGRSNFVSGSRNQGNPQSPNTNINRFLLRDNTQSRGGGAQQRPYGGGDYRRGQGSGRNITSSVEQQGYGSSTGQYRSPRVRGGAVQQSGGHAPPSGQQGYRGGHRGMFAQRGIERGEHSRQAFDREEQHENKLSVTKVR